MNTISFGWTHSTHKLFTQIAYDRLQGTKKFNNIDTEVLELGCIEPDFDRKKVVNHCHGHFADYDDLIKRPKINNAYNLAIRYTEKAIQAFNDNNPGGQALNMGRAIHFIQDMLNPYHVVFREVDKNHPERIMHKQFEKKAKDLQMKVAQNTRIDKIDKNTQEGFFKTFLPSLMKKTKQISKTLKNDSITERRAIEKSLQNTLIATCRFLEMFPGNLTNKVVIPTSFNSYSKILVK